MATRAESAERTHQVLEWLVEGRYKHQIVRQARDLWGIQYRQVQNYITRARQILAEEGGTSREDLRSESLMYYKQVCADPSLPPRERIRARQRIDQLMGLEAPQETVVHQGIDLGVHPIGETEDDGDGPPE